MLNAYLFIWNVVFIVQKVGFVVSNIKLQTLNAYFFFNQCYIQEDECLFPASKCRIQGANRQGEVFPSTTSITRLCKRSSASNSRSCQSASLTKLHQ